MPVRRHRRAVPLRIVRNIPKIGLASGDCEVELQLARRSRQPGQFQRQSATAAARRTFPPGNRRARERLRSRRFVGAPNKCDGVSQGRKTDLLFVDKETGLKRTPRWGEARGARSQWFRLKERRAYEYRRLVEPGVFGAIGNTTAEKGASRQGVPGIQPPQQAVGARHLG